jgi:uncharacterized membrane protein
MRSIPDRIRHALSFEIIGLAIFIPLFSWILQKNASEMGVIGFVSACTATSWNFFYNWGFDHAMLRWAGTLHKTITVRVLHAVLFEAGLILLLIPFIAWYLGISLWAALVMDIAIVVFYLVYAFCFNIAYDRVFPIPDAKKPE